MPLNINNNSSGNYTTYTIQANDTIDSIAKKYGTTSYQIIKDNNLDNNNLTIGKQIKISSIENNKNIYSTPTSSDNRYEEGYEALSKQNSNYRENLDQSNKGKIDYEKNEIQSIKEDVIYLSEKGYTSEEIKKLINDSGKYDLVEIGDTSYIDSVLQETTNQIIDGNANELNYEKDSILGLPFRYNYLSDPRRRVFNQSFLSDAYIVSFIPGKPRFRNSDPTITSIFNKAETDDETLGLSEVLNLNDDEPVTNWLLKSQKDDNLSANKDLRYYGFESDYENFLKYLELTLGTLAVKMGIFKRSSSIRNYINCKTEGGFANISQSFKFFADKSSTVDESISNQYSESLISSQISTSLSDAAKELLYVMGDGFNNNENNSAWTKFMDNMSDIIGKIPEALLGKNDDLANSISDITTSALAAAGSGVNMVFPEIWKTSNFSRNYSFSFEFMSPYGSPEAIFQYVYLPFLILFTLACPRQYKTNGYMSPFILRVDSPGYLTTDMAYIQNMSWTKGGKDGLFNKDNLPLAMTVNLSVTDLYPVVMMAKNYPMLRHNTGMHGFLDNMAGLSVERFEPLTSIRNSILTRASYINGMIDRKYAGVQSWIARITTPEAFKTSR